MFKKLLQHWQPEINRHWDTLALMESHPLEAWEPGSTAELLYIISIEPRILVTRISETERRINFPPDQVYGVHRMASDLKVLYESSSDNPPVEIKLDGLRGGAIDLKLNSALQTDKAALIDLVRVFRHCIRTCCPSSPGYQPTFDIRREYEEVEGIRPKTEAENANSDDNTTQKTKLPN